MTSVVSPNCRKLVTVQWGCLCVVQIQVAIIVRSSVSTRFRFLDAGVVAGLLAGEGCEGEAMLEQLVECSGFLSI